MPNGYREVVAVTTMLRGIAARFRRAFRAFESDVTPGAEPAGRVFTVVLHRDDLDGGWIAECPELPGCMSQGDTERDAVENIVNAIGEVLTLRMERQPPDDVSDPVGRCGGGSTRRFAVSV